jgi:iron complex transport system substrate-binding protein
MRICSFLPSGTEILFALGLEDSVVGVTFECDYPAEARTKEVVVYTKLPPGLPEREIDRQVNEFSSQGRSLYRLDAEKLRQLKPELIVTQDLCHVCAASPDDLSAVLATLSPSPQVLALTPHTIADVWNDIFAIGDATGRQAEATTLVANLERKIAQVRKNTSGKRPRVLCLEWLDRPFAAGHWVPEMVKLAGGIDVLGRAGEPGVELSWDAIKESDPDIILAMPCGYHREDVEAELQVVPFPDIWYSLRAVQNLRVFAMDASSHFSRPGPRITDGVVTLAQIFDEQTHPKKSASAERSWDRTARVSQR